MGDQSMDADNTEYEPLQKSKSMYDTIMKDLASVF